MRFRLVFACPTDFLSAWNNGVYFRAKKIRQASKSLTDLTHQLVQYPGWRS